MDGSSRTEVDTVMDEAEAHAPLPPSSSSPGSQVSSPTLSNGTASLVRGAAAIDINGPADDAANAAAKNSQAIIQTTTDNNSLAPPSTITGAPPSSSTSNKPRSSVGGAASSAGGGGAAAKEKKKAKSPSPPPLAPPTHIQTVRLEIQLGGPDNYAYDIAELAKANGQREPTPPRRIDISDSEGEDDDPKGKKEKAGREQAYYDLEDPFIDDSDLAVDERKYVAQTKESGFYVSQGEVALLKDKTAPKKGKSAPGKSKRPPLSAAGAIPNGTSIANALLSRPAARRSVTPSRTSRRSSIDGSHGAAGNGTRDSPIALYDEDEEGGGARGSLADILNHDGAGGAADRKRKLDPDAESRVGAGSDIGSGKKRRKVAEILPFHPDLETALADLKKLVETTPFEQKGKFPTQLKPELTKIALKAIELGDYDDNFFNIMPKIFPYNRFTMFKLIKRTVFTDHMALIAARQDALLHELKDMADDGFEKAKEDYFKALAAWEEKQEKKKAANAASGGGEEMDLDPQPPLHHDTEDGSTAVTPATGAKVDHPPVKRYRFTDAMKANIWNLVSLSNDSCALQNEKFELEGSQERVSDQGMRKTLYQRIQPLFPDGWMTTQSISREVSVMKKKHEKEVAKHEEDDG